MDHLRPENGLHLNPSPTAVGEGLRVGDRVAAAGESFRADSGQLAISSLVSLTPSARVRHVWSRIMGDGMAEVSIEHRINQMLATAQGERGAVTLATAESCTGGNVAARLTSLAGSSAYVLGGIVAYSNEAKASLLGVSQETLDTRGAVSAECACEMAEGARRAFAADFAISTTGIAGPGGATARKSVGLVHIALAGPDGIAVEEFHFPGTRQTITDAATDAALLMLLRGVERGLGKR